MIKKVLIGLLVLVVALVIAGFLLPKQYKVERAILINATSLTIYPLVAAPTNWQSWSVWNSRDPNMVLSFSGAGAGKGAKWSWQSKTEGNGEMEFIDEVSPRKLVYRLTFADWGMTSVGTMSLVPKGGAVTEVTWTSEGDLGNNPVYRYFGLFMDRMIGKDFESGLLNLKALAEKNSLVPPAAPAAKQTSAATEAVVPTDLPVVNVAPPAPPTTPPVKK